ncbi:MAG: GAF domain-containing protein [Comamonadaceae bacterium]|nr:MAG: GAF domain-containing protein [Comamonadaceae bacterium]
MSDSSRAAAPMPSIVSGSPVPDEHVAPLTGFLEQMRELLDMDVAFVSAFGADRRTIVASVARPDSAFPPLAGRDDPAGDSYCQHVLAGRLPMEVADMADCPAAAALPITSAAGIRSYISVPVNARNGHVIGTLCCLDTAPREAIGDPQRESLLSLAEAVAACIQSDRYLEQTFRPTA